MIGARLCSIAECVRQRRASGLHVVTAAGGPEWWHGTGRGDGCAFFRGCAFLCQFLNKFHACTPVSTYGYGELVYALAPACGKVPACQSQMRF